MSRTEALRDLYERIHACDRCFGAPGCEMEPDPDRVEREVIEDALDAEVMLLGESLGGKTQRRSGRPYLLPDGSLIGTGQTLDRFLGLFEYTIIPGGERHYIYSTDAVQRWPGLKANGKKRDPTPREVANCFEWFEAELELVEPRVLIIMGRPAVLQFFPRYLGTKVRRLGEVVGRRYQTDIAQRRIAVFAITHPSPLARGPSRDELYARVGAEVRELLNR